MFTYSKWWNSQHHIPTRRRFRSTFDFIVLPRSSRTCDRSAGRTEVRRPHRCTHANVHGWMSHRSWLWNCCSRCRLCVECGAPVYEIAKLVPIATISLWFMVVITLVTGACKPITTRGGHMVVSADDVYVPTWTDSVNFVKLFGEATRIAMIIYGYIVYIMYLMSLPYVVYTI